jgi:putative transposase
MKEAGHSESSVCRHLGISRSNVRERSSGVPTGRQLSNAVLREKIGAIFHENFGRYGSPRVYEELCAMKVPCSEKRVARLMAENGWVAKSPKRFVPATTDSNHDYAVPENELNREFSPEEPNQVWTGDITYLSTPMGWVYLATLIDLYSRRIVGWAIGASMHKELVTDALRMARAARPEATTVLVHHDRGSQYASHAYRDALKLAGFRLSMSRVAECWDNAPSESFFATFKRELGDSFNSLEHAHKESALYMHWYNAKRRHSHNAGRSPLYAELDFQAQLAA